MHCCEVCSAYMEYLQQYPLRKTQALYRRLSWKTVRAGGWGMMWNAVLEQDMAALSMNSQQQWLSTKDQVYSKFQHGMGRDSQGPISIWETILRRKLLGKAESQIPFNGRCPYTVSAALSGFSKQINKLL